MDLQGHLMDRPHQQLMILQDHVEGKYAHEHAGQHDDQLLGHLDGPVHSQLHDQQPEGGSIEVFSVDHRRTFCFVDDAVEMLVRSANSEACASEVLNLGCQSPEIEIRTLAEQVIATVGKRLDIDPRPATQGSPGRRCPGGIEYWARAKSVARSFSLKIDRCASSARPPAVSGRSLWVGSTMPARNPPWVRPVGRRR